MLQGIDGSSGVIGLRASTRKRGDQREKSEGDHRLGLEKSEGEKSKEDAHGGRSSEGEQREKSEGSKGRKAKGV